MIKAAKLEQEIMMDSNRIAIPNKWHSGNLRANPSLEIKRQTTLKEMGTRVRERAS